ncbi:hypothetical protein FPV67DRAFT_1092279 [Lyophyllum atratum]|nr:hypothetical protein FPV67DRAFT_1092279 [Lyophyllum atratum]
MNSLRAGLFTTHNHPIITMKFSSAILFTLPVVLASWTAMAAPGSEHKAHQSHKTVEGRDLARLTASNLVARHAAEWDIYQRDFEPETLVARRACKTSKDCLGMICINNVCQ